MSSQQVLSVVSRIHIGLYSRIITFYKIEKYMTNNFNSFKGEVDFTFLLAALEYCIHFNEADIQTALP